MRSTAVVVSICVPLWAGLTAQGVAQATAQDASAGSEQVQANARAVVPQQVRYAGKLATRSSESVEAVFRIYAAAEGGEPLWTETQQVSVAADGSYSVLLGASTAAGLPQAVFAGGTARWLGVSVERGEEQERVQLSSVPYAMKSADAESLAGHQAADFVTQAQLDGLSQQMAEKVSKVEQAVSAAPAFQPELSTPTGAGTANTVPLWTGAATLGNSNITQSGSYIGINYATPTEPLEVGGAMTVHGTLRFPPGVPATPTHSSQSQSFQFSASAWNSATAAPVSSTYTLLASPTDNNTPTPGSIFYFTYQPGNSTSTNLFTLNGNGLLSLPNAAGGISSYGNISLSPLNWATSTASSNSPLLEIGASAFSSKNNIAEAQTFAWQAQAGGNDTTALTGSLALLFGENGQTPAATGLSFARNGQITFAPGQQFPVTGTGGGTITGITTSSPLTGSGTTGSVPLGLNEGQLTTDIIPLIEDSLNYVYAELGSANDFAGEIIAHQSIGVGYGAILGYGTTGSYGIYGQSDSGIAIQAISATGSGVEGQTEGASTVGTTLAAQATSGVHGDVGIAAGLQFGAGILGTADDNYAGFFENGSSGTPTINVIADGDTNAALIQNNSKDAPALDVNNPGGSYAAELTSNSSTFPTLYLSNNAPGGPITDSTGIFKSLMATSSTGTCGIGGNGDLSCTGQVKSLVSAGGGARTVETYAPQSAENWMEDYGTGTMERGVAVVKIDPAFAETISESADYHVFLTPRGDSKSLYVINATTAGFEVRESGGGTSSLTFDYKIVGKRRGYETQRLRDVTESFNGARARAAQVRKPLPTPQLRMKATAAHPPIPKGVKAAQEGPERQILPNRLATDGPANRSPTHP